MKRLLSLLLVSAMALMLFSACGDSSSAASAASEAGSAAPASAAEEAAAPAGETGTPDWTGYDALIDQIRTTADAAERVNLMHQAEDMLMNTGCVVPLYYYVNQYMLSDNVEGMVWTVTGMKYFQYASKKDGDTTFNACLSSEPAYLDPQLNSSVDGGILAVNSFEGLMTYDADGNVVPGQAESYEEVTNEDGTVTYTFKMRDGLKWSNGDPLDASDFEYSWKRAVAAETAADYGYLYDVVARTEDGELDCAASEDGKTFTVTLNAPCAYFVELTAFPALFPVHQASVEAANTDGTVPGAWALEAGDSFVCNGAFVLKSWDHESSMTYVKNENYRDAANVAFETINYMLTSDDSVAFSAYNTGDLDLTLLIPTSEVANLNGKSDYHVDPYLGTYYVAFNIKSDFYAGLGLTTEEQRTTFRNAIGLLIDRDYICEEIGQAGQIPANTFIPAGCSDGNGGEFRSASDAYSYPVADELGYYSMKDYQANVTEAISLLESLGFKFDNGMLSSETPIAFDYLVNESTVNVAIGEAIQSDLANVGIQMSIVTEEWNVFLEDRKNGNYDFCREGWIMDYNDPINMLEMWTTDSGNNDCQFGR